MRSGLGFPVGAIIATVCFFLPWVKLDVSCAGATTRTGAELARSDPIFWLVLVAAALILVSYLMAMSAGRVDRARPAVLVAFAIAALTIAYKAIAGVKTQWGTFRLEQSESYRVTLEPGAFGTIAGFVIAALGALLSRSRSGRGDR
jgi:uncharacterized membrane protein HdeD (DUF308 family)